jgi:Zn-dependent membrane protease YugP
MNGAVLALMIAGLVGFGAGAYLAATGSREVGMILMGGGLLFQVLTLRQLRAAKKGAHDDR